MNFSISETWNNSLILRYPVEKIKKIDKLLFFEDNNLLLCQNFFNYNISDKFLEIINGEIENGKSLKFNYINNDSAYNTLKKWSIANNVHINIIDEWEAPKLILKENIDNYLAFNIHNQVKRNYIKYQKEKVKFKFHNLINYNPLKLWDYVLKIDNESWKKRENSDMKSLNREDLQYLPFILLNPQKSSLIVICDLNDNPLAYSLMFKGENDFWYAVKWGASDTGRKYTAGIFCLYYHLQYLYSLNNELKIDFWGRRNNTYDQLKNNSEIRRHIMITKVSD